MSIYRRPESTRYVVEVRWRGLPRLKLSTGSANKGRARAMERTLEGLKDVGRFDVLRLLGEGKLRLVDVHEDYQRDPASLQQRIAKVASPVLGPLVDEMADLAGESSGAVLKNPRPIQSPDRVPLSRIVAAAISGLAPRSRGHSRRHHQGLHRRVSRARRRDGKKGSTINRDLCALSAFRRWCDEERELAVPALTLPREREPSGRERWLSAEEIRELECVTPQEWWPLFATLAFTGLRIGEAQGLRGDDVRIAERRITVHGETRRLKTGASVRDVPIPEPLARLLAEHLTRNPIGPNDLLFGAPFSDYRAARRVFSRACRHAGLRSVTLHDLRHTFAVHAAQSGVPIPRIQKLLGHATVAMAMRYMKHAPEAYFAEDAARVAGSLTGVNDREREARADMARKSLRQVEAS